MLFSQHSTHDCISTPGRLEITVLHFLTLLRRNLIKSVRPSIEALCVFVCMCVVMCNSASVGVCILQMCAECF